MRISLYTGGFRGQWQTVIPAIFSPPVLGKLNSIQAVRRLRLTDTMAFQLSLSLSEAINI